MDRPRVASEEMDAAYPHAGQQRLINPTAPHDDAAFDELSKLYSCNQISLRRVLNRSARI